MSTPARQTALSVLTSFRKNNAWSDGELKQQLKKHQLNKREAALATRLCYGVLQNRLLLDFYISNYSNTPIQRLEPPVLDILRLGVYQLLFTDRIPESAAVNESVIQAKKHSNLKASGLVNGILRSIARNKSSLPEIPKENFAQYLSVKYSHPLWLVEALTKSVGESDIESLLMENNGQPDITVQVNTLKKSTNELADELHEQGIKADPHPMIEDCLVISDTGAIDGLSCFIDGSIIVQDAASRLAVMAMDPKKGEKILDGCAAPGGKSISCAIAMNNDGRILSTDLHEHKIRLIDLSSKRLGISIIEARTMDAKNPPEEFLGQFDKVLADVPCSGFGIIRKKPDIRFKAQEQLEKLPEIQLDILHGLSGCVKPGGILMYTTCTVLRRENEDVISSFLNAHPQFTFEDFEIPAGESKQGMLTLYPHMHHTDGFFICKMRLTYD